MAPSHQAAFIEHSPVRIRSTHVPFPREMAAPPKRMTHAAFGRAYQGQNRPLPDDDPSARVLPTGLLDCSKEGGW